jgi:O-antigen biosynthesis protein
MNQTIAQLINARGTFASPLRLTEVTSWHGHIPFAFFAVQMFKPRLLVELGTHKGDSYCAFCQAVETLNLPTVCFAVDTWQGDAQSGHYGKEVLEELATYHDTRYGHFSRLLPMTFDQALARFDDGSVDLLHIDGLHTYEAVRNDVETWLPKMSRQGVILLHDTHVTTEDFGVWRVWQEMAGRFPAFAFLHANGLGVLGVGEDWRNGENDLFHMGDPEADWLRRLFQQLGDTIVACHRARNLQEALQDARHALQAQHAYTGELERRLEEIADNNNLRGEYIESLEGRLTRMAEEREVIARECDARDQHIRFLEQRLAERLPDRLRRKADTMWHALRHRRGAV